MWTASRIYRFTILNLSCPGKGGQVVENLAECAKLSLSKFADYWTYKSEEKLCWVKSSKSGRKAGSDHVSGNSECGNVHGEESHHLKKK